MAFKLTFLHYNQFKSKKACLFPLLLLLLACQTSVSLANETQTQKKHEFITAQELAKTKALQFFVQGQSAEALEEFKLLAEQYPTDTTPKAYIGACLDRLQRTEEAIATFQEILTARPSDLASRQYLAKIYLRRGDFDQAKKELTYIEENDKKGTFAKTAKADLKIIEQLRESNMKITKAPRNQIGPEEFLKSKAAQYFLNKKYKDALAELQTLEKKYPEDLLIKRYIGLTLDKLGSYREAFTTYQSALRIAPENIPIHYSVAQVLLHEKDYEGAKREFEYIVERDESGAYKARAEQELKGVQRIIEFLKRAKPKKWAFNASGSAEYNTNATAESRVPEFRSQAHQSGWKFSNSAGGSYDLWQKKAWTIKGIYNYYQAFYSDSLSQLNVISNATGANATYLKIIDEKPLILQLGHMTAYTIVRDDYYSTSLIQYATGIYSPKNWYRITLTERWTFSSYEKEGTEPDVTSRDGFGNVTGWTNTFYMNKKKSLYYLLGCELQRDDTQGVNYIKNALAIQTGFHFPLLFKSQGDLTFKFKESEFPKYSPTGTYPERHHEEEYNFEAGISKKLTSRWTLSATYKLTMTESEYDLYTYTNNALGFTLSYNY